MLRILSVLAVVAQAFALLASTDGVESPTKKFESVKYSFTLRYPATWYILRQDADTLAILSFPPSERLQGVVIKSGGASIDAFPAPQNVNDLEEWIAENQRGDTVLHRGIEKHNAAKSACNRITRVVVRSEIGPKSYVIVTRYYCSTSNGLYQVSVENWEGDPKQRYYQGVGLDIARSLRTVNH